MGIYDFFTANYAAATAATSTPSDSRTPSSGPQGFEVSNESTPSRDSTSDSSRSDSTRNHNSSHEFRMPFTDSENSNSSSSSESEANISLSESDKRQSQSDGSNASSSTGSGNSPKSKLMYDAWQNRGQNSNTSSPDRSAIGSASSERGSSRSSGSRSSTDSALRQLPTAKFENGENSTAAGEASLQTTDSYGWPVPNDKSREELHPTARKLTGKIQTSKSSDSGSRTSQRDNSGRQGTESPSSEESGNQGSTSRVQPKNPTTATGKKGSKGDGSSGSSSSESSASDDSSAPAGPIPLETSFDKEVGSEESFSSVSSSSSDESGSQSESASSFASRRSKEESSDNSSSESRQESREKKKETSNPLKRMEENRQKRLSDSEGSSSSRSKAKKEGDNSSRRDTKEKKTSTNSSSGSSSSESRYEMKSDATILRSANSFGAGPEKTDDTSSHSASKSSHSSSEESALSPLPQPRIERLKGGSTSSSARSSDSSRGSASSKSRNEKSYDRSPAASESSGSRSKDSRSASPPPRSKKRDINSSGSDSKRSLESFGSSSSSTSNSRALMKSFGYVAADAQVTDHGSTGSSKSAGSKSRDSPKPKAKEPRKKSSDSSKSSGSSASKVSPFGLASSKPHTEKVKYKSASDDVGELNNFALDKKLELKSDSSSSSGNKPALIEKPRQWSDFVPSPSTDPDLIRTADATARSEHDSDEFQWVPSDKNGWMPPIRPRLGREARETEKEPLVPHLQRQRLLSEAKHDVVSEALPKPDPPFGNVGSRDNVFDSSEMPLFYANILSTGTHRPHMTNAVGNVAPVPPMDMKMRQKGYHGIPPMSEITVFPAYDDGSTLGTEGFHYAPFMMGDARPFDQQPQHASRNVRQLNPWPAVKMSEVLRNEGADPPEVKGTDRASSYLQFINPPQPPPVRAQEVKHGENIHPSYRINANIIRRPEESENSWVPTQLKSELKSGGPIHVPPPKEDLTLEDPKNLLYSETAKPPSEKSSSAASNWNPTQASQPSRKPPIAMVAPNGSFRAGGLANADTMEDDEESEEEVIVEDDVSSAPSSAYDEVTVASEQSEQNSRPTSQMSEPDSEESSSGSSYHPTGILDSSSESSSESFSARRSRAQAAANQSRPPIVQPNQRKPPIITPYQRNQPHNTNDVEDQKHPLSGGQKSKRPTALIYAIIALGCLLLILGAGAAVYFLTRENEAAPAVASVNPPTNRPTTFVPTQSYVPTQMPSLAPTLASRTPSLSPTKSPTPAPSRPPGDPEVLEDAYYKLIVSAYPQGGDAIQNRSSPQRSAFEWLRSVSNVQDLPDNRVLQRYALATLFYSTRGWEWSKASRWLSNEHECSWFSTSAELEVCNQNKELTVLSLRENNLDGTVPAEIFALLPLVEVQLHGNDLEGSIPTEVSNLSRLALFDLSSNQVFSNIPSQLGGLSNLKRIALANNKIFSTIPTELGRLSLLETLDLGANQLTGTIPTALKTMTSLAGLSLYANYISGTVPTNFSTLSNLQLIYIDGNYLSGSVSNSLCQLQVREFWADCDRLTCSCCTTCCTAQGCGN